MCFSLASKAFLCALDACSMAAYALLLRAKPSFLAVSISFWCSFAIHVITEPMLQSGHATSSSASDADMLADR